MPNVREFNLKLTHHFHIVFTDSKVVNTITHSGFDHSMQLVGSIVDSHMSILYAGDKAESRRVLEEFLSDVSRPGRRISRLRNDLGLI